ncbi:Small-conductance mechanosensitive channel [Salinihabitans flavidus]|uniref:Small-conductance mechanosensitive channel n=1 Tax=Salinihabitans flavidus TaxID=569882 RepID=A0A1H8TDD1_9RHOB|nr:DUF3772 domain-containing protein [Salinihabitans flavidus]SEO88937.1 Small-conductance mechanosensitive channel [Salinihabitans flavidus]
MNHILRLAAALCLSLLMALSAAAQASDPPDYDAWRNVSERAQDVVSSARASDVALGELRQTLVTWRQTFQQAQSVNRSEIETVQAQLNTLGAPPEDGSEPEEIAEQRAKLNTRLTDLKAPVRRAELAYTEANALIGNVDEIIRERQTERLLEFGPSPLNPVNWARGFDAVMASLASIGEEGKTAWANRAQRETLRSNLPRVGLLLALALLLMTRARLWMERLVQSILSTGATAGRWLAAFLVSLGQVVLPLAGVYALTEALYATEMAGMRGSVVLNALPEASAGFLIALWLGAQVFSRSDEGQQILNLPAAERRQGRLAAGLLGLVFALGLIIQRLAEFETWSDAANVAIFFPFLLLAGLLMMRIAQLLHHHHAAEGEEASHADRLIGLFARFLRVVAIAGPVLAAVGYSSAAEQLMFPTILTVFLLAGLLLFQMVVTNVYILLTGNREGVRESLIPVLAGFGLVLAALPVLALIWGARLTDLAELWARVSRGISFGETTITPGDVLTLLIVFVIGYMVTRLVQGTLKTTILPKTRLDVGGQNAMVAGLGYFGIFLAALIAVTAAGIDLTSIALVAGALSVGIGFGLQTIVSNFVSGIILLIERPISEGDWIEVGPQMGIVRDISVRSTRIETFDRTDVIIPNTDLIAGTVINYTRGNTIGRVTVPVGVAYGTDPRKVEKILLEIGRDHPMVVLEPAPYVVFQGFGASSLDFEIRAILRDVNWILSVRSEMNYEIARRFAEEGIEIPFAQRDIWLRNPEALRGGSQTAPEPEPEMETSRKPDAAVQDRSGATHLTEADMDTDGEADGGDR